jgi:plastocyanin
MVKKKSMKTSYIIAAVAILLLLAGGGYFLSTRNAQSPATTSTQDNTMNMDMDSQDNTMNTQTMPANQMNTMEATGGAADDTNAMTSDATEIVVEGTNFKFAPATINAKQGEKIRLVFKNTQGFHDFVIDGMVATKQIQAGNEDIVEFTPTQKGTFEFYCSVGKHREMGMKGTLVVS